MVSKSIQQMSSGSKRVSTKTIGFIGVGLMGHGMAKNIVEKGFPLLVMGHRNRAPVEDLVGRGATEVKTAREMAEKADIIHICVTGSPQVEAVMEGEQGIIAGAKSGLIVIDTSTADPNSTLALAEKLATKGAHLVDAPLSRTPKEAEAGTLDTMVGATPELFEAVKPVISTWSTNIVHIGKLGDGHKMKLLNNFIAMGYAALYSEALAIADQVGITPQAFNSVIGTGRMTNGFYETFMKWTLERDESAHRFAISNGHKDMRYFSAMANEAGAVNPIASAVKNYFAGAEAVGRGDKYVPMLADYVASLNGRENT
ncbi:MAG: NAD(P)-dependent oxidoreductase [Pseudomonadota bacterium]